MKTNFGKRLETYKEHRKETMRKDMRTIKLIAETVKIMIKNNNKRLTNADIKQISLKVYNKYDKSKAIGVYKMINSPAIKEEVNNKLLDYYIKQGIDPINKVFELTNKAEEVAKNTADYMRVADHYKDIAKIASPNAQITQKETIDYAAIADSDELIEQKRTVTRTVTQAISTDSAKTDAKEPDLSNNDKTETQ